MPLPAPTSKNKSIKDIRHWGKQSQNAVEIKAMNSPSSCLPETPARAQCSIIQPSAELPRARAAPSTCQFPSHQRKQPFLHNSCKEQGLTIEFSANGRGFFIWPDGFNRQDPTLSMISSIILPCPLSLEGAGVMKSPSFSFHFLSLPPSLQSCYLF